MEERKINPITHNLVQKIGKKPYSKKIKKSAKTCFLEFIQYLENLKKKHKFKDKSDSSAYVIGLIFKNYKKGKKNVEFRNLAKQQICLALKYLKILKEGIEKNHGKLSYHSIVAHESIIRDFVLDLKQFVEYYEPSEIFFSGWKNYNHNSFEILIAAQRLLWSSGSVNIRHKEATNLSVFALRQSLEIKFKRILGLYDVYNEKHNGPKIRHDFFIRFIESNLDLIETPDYNFTDLVNLYAWTNHCIHNAMIPRVWELLFAFDYVRDFYKAGEAKIDGKRIRATGGVVKIKDYQELKIRLCTELEKLCPDEILCVSFLENPEGIVLKK